MRRPSPATAISIAALFIALSVPAYAATNGNFILGKPNTADKVSSLTNTTGTALSLSSKAGTAPLSVGNTVQVPNLNASLLGGKSASSFLAANGTAVNSNALGSIGPSGFIQGRGHVATNTIVVNAAGANNIVQTPDAKDVVTGYCDYAGGTGAFVKLFDSSSGLVYVVWWNSAGVGSATFVNGGSAYVLGQSTAPYIVLVQLTDAGARVATFTVTMEWIHSGFGDQCLFYGHVLVND